MAKIKRATLDPYLSLYRDRNKVPVSELVRSTNLPSTLDRNDDGYVSRKELKKWLKSHPNENYTNYQNTIPLVVPRSVMQNPPPSFINNLQAGTILIEAPRIYFAGQQIGPSGNIQRTLTSIEILPK